MQYEERYEIAVTADGSTHHFVIGDHGNPIATESEAIAFYNKMIDGQDSGTRIELRRVSTLTIAMSAN